MKSRAEAAVNISRAVDKRGEGEVDIRAAQNTDI